MTMASPSMMQPGGGGGSSSTPSTTSSKTTSHHHQSRHQRTSSFMTPSTTNSSARSNHILLGGSARNSSLSMRIEDPKKSSPALSAAAASMATNASPSPTTTLQAAGCNLSSCILVSSTATNNTIISNSNTSHSDLAEDVSLRIMLEKVPLIRDHFAIVEKLGEGTFSKVYKAVRLPPTSTSSSSSSDVVLRDDQTPPSSSEETAAESPTLPRPSYALKYITPIVKPGRIAKELRFLRDLQGQSNIVQLVGCLFAAGHTVLVMPIVEHDRFQDVYQRMDVGEARDYLRNLLLALDRVHRLGIVHRDVKPANFLYSRARRQYVLVDFGLSQTQKEIDGTAAQLTMHQALGGGAGGGSRSAPPVRPCDPASRVRSNLSIRFKNDALIMQHESNASPAAAKDNKSSPAPSVIVCRRNLTDSLTTLSPTKTASTQTQTPSKAKRSFAEIRDENQIDHLQQQQQTQNQSTKVETPVKRQRICGLDFIERATAVEGGGGENSTATTTTSTTSAAANSFYIPETPVKGHHRTPLGNRDSNQGGGGLCTATSIAPLSLNVFTTPTKTTVPVAMELVDHHQQQQQHRQQYRTPVKQGPSKDHQHLKYVPETPPKAVTKNLIFASSAKSALKQKENQSTATTASTAGSKNQANQAASTVTTTTSACYPQGILAQSHQNQHPNQLSNFNTPKAISYTSMKRSLQSRLRLQDGSHLSTSASATAVNGGDHHPATQPIKPCDCTAQAFICQACLAKPELNVPRAGTPGFRAPEVLLRSAKQSSKLDIWSAGVIFASILSGRYPFFRCMDDITCLAEIVTIFGSSRVKRAAAGLGKSLIISGGSSGGSGGGSGKKTAPVDLKALCCRLRASLEAAQPSEVLVGFEAPDSAYDLLGRLLDPSPVSRYSAAEALNHPFFKAEKSVGDQKEQQLLD